MTDLEILRQAASLMRQRAKAASLGPWYENGPDGIYAYGADTGPCPTIFRRSADGTYADVVHAAAIATPEVALAVAAWLTIAADDLASANGVRNHCDNPGEIASAVTVARTYLRLPSNSSSPEVTP